MNIAQMMKQAQAMQSKLADLQSQMANAEVTGSAGNGAVTVTMTGKGEARKVSIDASVMDDKDMLEDLLVAALNDARNKIDTATAAETEKLMGGLGLPGGLPAGLKLPF